MKEKLTDGKILNPKTYLSIDDRNEVVKILALVDQLIPLTRKMKRMQDLNIVFGSDNCTMLITFLIDLLLIFKTLTVSMF